MIRSLLVNESVGEIRKRPDHASEQVSQVILGAALHRLSSRDKGAWHRVQTEDGYTGWIRDWAVHPFSAAALETYRSGPSVEVDSMIARIRSRASAASLPDGAKLAVANACE